MGASGMLATQLQQIDATADLLSLDEELHQILRAPKRMLSVAVPIERESGTVQVFAGYRVQHNINRGPALGGLRYAPGSTLEEVTALAMLMTWKCGLLRLPFGGAAGAIVCDPGTMGRRELERLTRRYTSEISMLIGPTSDIITPDVNTNAQVMAWIMDTYSMHQGYSVPAVATGKPLSIGGTQGQAEATGRGLFYVLRELSPAVGLASLAGARIVVQGFGSVGRAAALACQDAGCRVVAVSDLSGGILNPQGLQLRPLISRLGEHRLLHDVAAEDTLTNSELLALPCDVLILAAAEEQVTTANVHTLQTRLVIEGANGPVSGDADALLQEAGITVIPDILAGSGGAVVSYFEWVQSLQEHFWSETEVNRRLEESLVAACHAVLARRARMDISLRAAAYMQAMEAVARATDTRGIYP